MCEPLKTRLSQALALGITKERYIYSRIVETILTTATPAFCPEDGACASAAPPGPRGVCSTPFQRFPSLAMHRARLRSTRRSEHTRRTALCSGPSASSPARRGCRAASGAQIPRCWIPPTLPWPSPSRKAAWKTGVEKYPLRAISAEENKLLESKF